MMEYNMIFLIYKESYIEEQSLLLRCSVMQEFLVFDLQKFRLDF